jgi:hypothetical protein
MPARMRRPMEAKAGYPARMRRPDARADTPAKKRHERLEA